MIEAALGFLGVGVLINYIDRSNLSIAAPLIMLAVIVLAWGPVRTGARWAWSAAAWCRAAAPASCRAHLRRP